MTDSFESISANSCHALCSMGETAVQRIIMKTNTVSLQLDNYSLKGNIADDLDIAYYTFTHSNRE